MFMSKLKRFFSRKLHKIQYYGSFWNYVHGFSKQTVELNGINKQNYKVFLDDRRYRQGHPYNGRFSSIIDNKLYLPYLLKDYPEYVPEYYFFVSNGQISSLNKKKYDDGFDSFLRLLRGNRALVLKHCYSWFGDGFIKLEYVDADSYKLNNEIVSTEGLFQRISHLHDYICTECIKQHDYSSSINYSSLNTIRFLCVRDYSTHHFYLSRCFHRFGTKGSLVDNLGGRGNAYLFLVDIEKGTLKQNGMMSFDGKEVYQDTIHYPGDRAFAGMPIPFFDDVKRKILEISDSFPFLHYIGWDVAITNDGFKIIEANSLTSLGILQREGGFLEDERLSSFFLNSK